MRWHSRSPASAYVGKAYEGIVPLASPFSARILFIFQGPTLVPEGLQPSARMSIEGQIAGQLRDVLRLSDAPPLVCRNWTVFLRLLRASRYPEFGLAAAPHPQADDAAGGRPGFTRRIQYAEREGGGPERDDGVIGEGECATQVHAAFYHMDGVIRAS